MVKRAQVASGPYSKKGGEKLADSELMDAMWHLSSIPRKIQINQFAQHDQPSKSNCYPTVRLDTKVSQNTYPDPQIHIFIGKSEPFGYIGYPFRSQIHVFLLQSKLQNRPKNSTATRKERPTPDYR